MSLFDYELIVGDHGQRLLAFGKYAGRAGLIDFLRGLGHSMFPCLVPTIPFPNSPVFIEEKRFWTTISLQISKLRA